LTSSPSSSCALAAMANHGAMELRERRYSEAYGIFTQTLAFVKAELEVLEGVQARYQQHSQHQHHGDDDDAAAAAPRLEHATYLDRHRHQPVLLQLDDRVTVMDAAGDAACATEAVAHCNMVRRIAHLGLETTPAAAGGEGIVLVSHANQAEVPTEVTMMMEVEAQEAQQDDAILSHPNHSSPSNDDYTDPQTMSDIIATAKASLAKVAACVMFNLALQHHMQAIDTRYVPESVLRSSSSEGDKFLHHEDETAVAGTTQEQQQQREQDARNYGEWRCSMLTSAGNLYKTALCFIRQQLQTASAAANATPSSAPSFFSMQELACLELLVGSIWNNLADVCFAIGGHDHRSMARSCLENLLIHLAISSSANMERCVLGDNQAPNNSSFDAIAAADHSRQQQAQHYANVTDQFWNSITIKLWEHHLAAASA